MSIGKRLSEPLFLALVAQGLLFGWALWRARAEKRRWLRLLPSVPMLAVWILSLDLSADLLERSLAVPVPSAPEVPALIVALSGGYHNAGGAERSFLTPETEVRILAAVERWKAHPTAKLVVSGASHVEDGDPADLSARLMAEVAMRAGVPRERLVLEPLATNTADHPIRVLALPGVSRDTWVEIVTSPWHLRRAVGAFERYFAKVGYAPAYPVTGIGVCVPGLLPRVEALTRSTTMLHEWIGLLWYRLTPCAKPCG